MYKLLDNKELTQRRWCWELLQNAKDVVKDDGKVEILLTKKFLEFRHKYYISFIYYLLYLIININKMACHSLWTILFS